MTKQKLKVNFSIYKCFYFPNLGLERETTLHWVKINFATPTFDRITKDVKANFETKLSTIGGTMGLLTGFSIISGIEMVYFAIKICVGFVQQRMVKTEKLDSHVK